MRRPVAHRGSVHFCRPLLRGALLAAVLLATAPAGAQNESRALFQRLDVDRDGKLTQQELPERQRPNFARMDANKDGSISPEELESFRRGDLPPENRPTPTHPDVSYGPHERNRIDLYLVESEQPTPLVLFIHGGGFQQGDKRNLSAGVVREYHRQGWSVAAINYRFTNVAPAPAQYLDCARAIQFLRHHAGKWNINPRLIASTGSSAGAGTSLWIAFHDDLADPDSDDPVARESTRLTCVAVSNGQSSYDPRFAAKIGIPRPNFERHGFFRAFYGIRGENEYDTPETWQKYEAAAPITYLTADDPPVHMHYTYRNETVTPETALGVIVHHPLLGIALQEAMSPLGIECVVQYRENDGNRTVRHDGGEVIPAVEFIRRHFEAAAKTL